MTDAGGREDELSGWTIFDHPSDYPQHFVVRRFAIGKGEVTPTADVFLADSLDAARAGLLCRHRGLTCFSRWAEDDPVIVEMWL